MGREVGRAAREVERLLRDGVETPGGDARLLHRYLAEGDESAFEAIVDRHGPLVLALCRRHLHNPADVEDAFQATFLVLVRKGPSLRDGDALSSWLYGVAFRVASRARSDLLRRRAREEAGEAVHAAVAGPSPAPDEALEVLDRELARLPEKYRAPLVLCHLKGRTHDQAAAELGWPVGTVRSRMARARALLRRRLAAKGVEAPSGLSKLRAELAALPFAPPSLVATTVAAAGRLARTGPGLVGWLSIASSPPPRPAEALARGVLMSMSTSSWKPIGFALASVALVGALAAGTLDAPARRQEPPPPEGRKEQSPPRPDVEGRLADVEKKLDRLLDLVAKPAEPPADPAASPSAPPSSSIQDVGRAIGLAPAAVEAAPDPTSLRQIEAQLVSAYRKYRIIEEYLGRRNDFVSELQAQSLREDAVAPARVLLARLHELEAEAAEAEARSHKELGAAEDSLGRARMDDQKAQSELKRAEERVVKHGLTPAQARELADSAPRGPSSIEVVDSFRRALGNANVFKDRLALCEQSRDASARKLAGAKGRTAGIARLVSWSESHFKDVMLTIDDVDPAAK